MRERSPGSRCLWDIDRSRMALRVRAACVLLVLIGGHGYGWS